MASLQVIAQQGDEVFQKIMEFEPTVAGIASAVIPGAAPVVALVQPELLLFAPVLEKALTDLSEGNAGNAAASLLQLIMHNTAGLPNAPILGPHPAPAA